MSTNNENNKNGESLTINFQTAQLDPIDISRKMLLFNSMQNKHFKNHNDNWVDSSKRRNDAKNLTLLNNVKTFIK